MGLAVSYLIVLSLVQLALPAIFQTALCLYPRDRQAPAGFRAEVLDRALSWSVFLRGNSASPQWSIGRRIAKKNNAKCRIEQVMWRTFG